MGTDGNCRSATWDESVANRRFVVPAKWDYQLRFPQAQSLTHPPGRPSLISSVGQSGADHIQRVVLTVPKSAPTNPLGASPVALSGQALPVHAEQDPLIANHIARSITT